MSNVSGGSVIPSELKPRIQVTGFVDSDLEGRHNDLRPYYMGSAIVPKEDPEDGCSLGVPITVHGRFTVMTAGHCFGTEFFTPGGNYVGRQYTTAVTRDPKTTKGGVYGDWKLISGSNYAMKAFSGGKFSSDTLEIDGGRWAEYPVGQHLCKSGAATGSHCRMVVLRHGRGSLAGVPSAFTTTMRYDPNLNGGYLCTATDGGDSGGLIYYSHGKGIIAYGIHRGKKSDPNYAGRCTYQAVRIAGVRAWSSDAVVN